MQLRPLALSTRRTTDGRPPPPWVRVRSTAVGLSVDFLPSRLHLGQIVLTGEALTAGEVTVHLSGHGTIDIPLISGETAADVALELGSRILTETEFDASVRTRGAGFSVALGQRQPAN